MNNKVFNGYEIAFFYNLHQTFIEKLHHLIIAPGSRIRRYLSLRT